MSRLRGLPASVHVAMSDPAHITATRLRFGTRDDLSAITRLIQRANAADRVPRIDDHELETVVELGRLLALHWIGWS